MSFYAATKKSTENMVHSNSDLIDLPITMFRFLPCIAFGVDPPSLNWFTPIVRNWRIKYWNQAIQT